MSHDSFQEGRQEQEERDRYWWELGRDSEVWKQHQEYRKELKRIDEELENASSDSR